jgi:CheY-like chemotaxis protein
MTQASDGSPLPSHDLPTLSDAHPGSPAGADRAMPDQVLVVDADHALLGLLEEWLIGHGCRVVADRDDGSLVGQSFALAIVDVPFPRRGGSDALHRVARRFPGIPVFVLSSGFFAGIECTGAVARALGVTGVLPKPLGRKALIDALRVHLSR